MTGSNAHVERGNFTLKMTAEDIAARRSRQPDAPCFKCGERGWCRHRPDPGGK